MDARFLACVALLGCSTPAFSALVVQNTTLIGSERVSRTEWNFTYRLAASNTGAMARSVHATVTSRSPHTVIVDGEVALGDIAGGSSASSSDTFTVRHNRSFPFSPAANLAFRFQAETEVAPQLDANRAAHAVIGAAGGVLEAVAANGTRFILTVPPNAVLSATDVTLTATPLTSVAGLPVSGPFLAGVQFAPDGLALSKPASLRIELPAVVARDRIAAFHYAGNGENFAFHPLYPGDVDTTASAVTLHISHFSGYGAAEATSEDIAEASDSELAGVLQGLQELTPEVQAQLRQVLTENFNRFVVPALINAADYTALHAAIGNATEWEIHVQNAGLSEDFETDTAALKELITDKYNELFAEADTQCRAQPEMCSRGPHLRDFADELLIAELAVGIEDFPTVESFCDALQTKLPVNLTIDSPASVEVGYGSPISLEASFHGAGNVSLHPSNQTLADLHFRWSTPGIETSNFSSNPLQGLAVGDEPFTVTATACGLSASIEVRTKIDISGSWSGSGSEFTSCPNPQDNEGSSGSGTVQLAQNGSFVSGSVAGTSISGTLSRGPEGTFTLSGIMSGNDEGVPFIGNFTASGLVFGAIGSLSASWSGTDVGEEPCTFSGNGTATR